MMSCIHSLVLNTPIPLDNNYLVDFIRTFPLFTTPREFFKNIGDQVMFALSQEEAVRKTILLRFQVDHVLGLEATFN